MSNKISIFWLRRDLRLSDNHALAKAIENGNKIQALFIFDENILTKLADKKDARLSFIHDQLWSLKQKLINYGGDLDCKYGKPINVWKKLIKEYEISEVYANKDYEPYALERDDSVKKLLRKKNINFHTYKDHVIFEKDEVTKDDGLPYTVFTPYSRKWRKKLLEGSNTKFLKKSKYLKAYNKEEELKGQLHEIDSLKFPSLKSMGFEKSTLPIPSAVVKRGTIRKYTENRNFPALDATSKLGIHFRFGTISIREKARVASELNETFLNELIWRDFYSMILFHFPHVVENPFRKKYEFIEWTNNETHYKLWQEGKTGYPLVDAGMRELNNTGFMHNRVRMVVASFLSKHLLLDYRWGEAYFAEKLLDFDLASNNGGWQWAAGCGTDAAPYFRIFNPTSQQQKFDKTFEYIKKWVPEYGTDDYPQPIVDHKTAREKCLATYKIGLEKASKALV